MKRNTSKNWSNAIILLLVVLNLVLASLLLFRPLQPPKPNPKHMVKPLKRNLKLSAEQADQFTQILEAHVSKMQKNGDEIRSLRQKLPGTIDMSPSDREAFIDQIAALEKAQLTLISDHYSDLRELFTADQFKKFVELHKRRPGPRGRGPR